MSTLTQFLAGKLKSQEFLSSGTFTVPAGVTTVWVTMTGGGGSGSANGGTGPYPTGGGAAGAYCVKQAVVVTPGASISVTIGAGGAAVAHTSGNNVEDPGNPGGATSFGSLSVSGGGGGRGPVGANVGGALGGYFVGNSQVLPTSCGGKPGACGSFTTGGGAGGLFGDGGAGNVSSATGGAAAANSGAGGGSGATNTVNNSVSGAGGSGRCIVEWLA